MSDKVKEAAAMAKKLRSDAKKLEKAAGLEHKFVAIEEALGLRDRTHRHRIAKKYGLPLNARDDVPTWPQLSRLLFDKMVEFETRPESAGETELKEDKLREEIAVLKERNKKLQFENETTAGNMANIHRLRENLMGVMVPLQKVGEMFARKAGLTGPDAQQMLNKALEDYERLLGQQLSSNG